MSLLGDLPSELLGAICLRHESIALWKCGSKRLMSKLSNGVLAVHLEDPNFNSTSRFPKCLSSFHKLRELSIRRGQYRLADPEDIRTSIQSLSPSLEHLELRFTEVEQVFAEPTSIVDIFDESLYGKLQPRAQIWNIGSVFPKLHTLILEDEHLESTSWTSLDFESLPSTLTYLRMANRQLLNPDFCAALPKSIQILDLEGNQDRFLSSEFCASLPRGLTSIGSLQDNSGHTDLEGLASLPKGLSALSIHLPPSTPQLTTLDIHMPSLVFAEFTNLTQLSLYKHDAMLAEDTAKDIFFRPDWLKSLPKTLKTLQLPTKAWANNDAVLRIGDMQYLPPGLTDLALARLAYDSDHFTEKDGGGMVINPVDFEALYEKFPKLLHLSLDVELASADLIRFLPRTLTHLHLQSSSKRVNNLDSVDFPPNLKTLYWRHPFHNTHDLTTGIASPGPIDLLPRHLTRMSITSEAVWTKQVTSHLPRTLTEVVILHALITEEAFEVLPPYLKNLEISQFAKESDKIALLPFRTISEPTSHEREWMEWSQQDEEWDHDLEEREEMVVTEDINEGETQDIEATTATTSMKMKPKRLKRHVSLEKLPQGLKHLLIRKQMHYSPGLIASLPRGLRSLEVPFMNPSEAIQLPRGLTVLWAEVEGSMIDSDIDALPKSISCLNLIVKDRSQLSPDLDALLPPNLIFSNVDEWSPIRVSRLDRERNEPMRTPDPRVIARGASS